MFFFNLIFLLKFFSDGIQAFRAVFSSYSGTLVTYEFNFNHLKTVFGRFFIVRVQMLVYGYADNDFKF